MIEASCHCGAVRFEIARAPDHIFDCNCSICRRLGTLWAYYHPDQVRRLTTPEATFAYRWGDRSLEFHHCRNCGCTTHWQAIDTDTPQRMGVNARLMHGLDRSMARLRQIDGAGTGVFWTAPST
jgi:hypothetical protein